MASIFDLKTNTAELSSANQGTSRMSYDQHPPSRDVTGANFPNGAIHVRWQVSGQKWWLPSRSYCRIRGRLSQGNASGSPIPETKQVAPNMGLAGNLFQNGEFRIQDKTVSRCGDFMAQVDALETRLSKSKSWLDGIGQVNNFWSPDYSSREADRRPLGLNNGEQEVRINNTSYGYGATLELKVDASGLVTSSVVPTTFQTDGLVAGDELEIYTGAAYAVAGYLGRFRIIAVPTQTTIQLEAFTRTAIGAAVHSYVVIKAQPARRLREFELNWVPPLSIFKVQHALPAGHYELILNPQTASAYQLRAVESLLTDLPPGVAATDWKFDVIDMYLMVASVEGPRADDITYLLDLEQTRLQVDDISQTGLQQKNFDVSPSSYALTVAVQDKRAGSVTPLSASKFKVRSNDFKTLDQELGITRFYLNYAGQNKPTPDSDQKYLVSAANGVEDFLMQRYVESQLYSGAYFDSGGCESLADYLKRGAYYYFAFPRDGTDRSTRVNVAIQFAAAVDNARVLLFDHSKQVARVKVQDGRVTDVQLEDA